MDTDDLRQAIDYAAEGAAQRAEASRLSGSTDPSGKAAAARLTRLADRNAEFALGAIRRLGRHLNINVYGEPTSEWPEGRPICQCHTAGDAQRIVAAVNAPAEQPPPMYPDTRFLALCTLEGRRGGDVTVGESQLSVVNVLAMIRAHGVEEARLVWPQLSEQELSVLERLVSDLDARETEDT